MQCMMNCLLLKRERKHEMSEGERNSLSILCPINYRRNSLYLDALNMLYATYKMALEYYPAENIAFLGGSSGAAMVLWLMSWINKKGEGVPMPGKIALSSPGSALTAEERKRAEELNKTDLIMNTTPLDNIFQGMMGGKELPEEF